MEEQRSHHVPAKCCSAPMHNNIIALAWLVLKQPTFRICLFNVNDEMILLINSVPIEKSEHSITHLEESSSDRVLSNLAPAASMRSAFVNAQGNHKVIIDINICKREKKAPSSQPGLLGWCCCLFHFHKCFASPSSQIYSFSPFQF